MAVVEAAEHLCVHALEGVLTKNGFYGAAVNVVGVERFVLEVVTFVVACEDGPGREPGWSHGLSFDELEA